MAHSNIIYTCTDHDKMRDLGPVNSLSHRKYSPGPRHSMDGPPNLTTTLPELTSNLPDSHDWLALADPKLHPGGDTNLDPEELQPQPRPGPGPSTQESGTGSSWEGGGGGEMGGKVGSNTGISNFHEYDSLDFGMPKPDQYSGVVQEKYSLTQSMSRGCRGTGYRGVGVKKVVNFGLGKNRGKQGRGGHCNSRGAWERTLTGEGFYPDKFRGLKPGVPEKLHTSGGGGNLTNLASLSVPQLNLGVFEGDEDIPERQSSKKGKESNDPPLILRKDCEGSLVHTRLSLKTYDLGEMMSPLTVSLEGLDGMTTVEVGGGGHICL